MTINLTVIDRNEVDGAEMTQSNNFRATTEKEYSKVIELVKRAFGDLIEDLNDFTISPNEVTYITN